MATLSNLPATEEQIDSSSETKKFFETYYSEGITVSSNSIDSVTGFFESRGFERSAAVSIGSVLLSQARVEQINVFNLLDTLKGLSQVQLSRVVTEILNYNRLNISTLGYRIDNSESIEYEKRNVIA